MGKVEHDSDAEAKFDQRNQALEHCFYIELQHRLHRTQYLLQSCSNNSLPLTTTATIPYTRGTSETIARILRSYNIRVAHTPMFSLRRLLTNVKDKDEPEDRPGAVYKIKCSDCQGHLYRRNRQKLYHTTKQTQKSS